MTNNLKYDLEERTAKFGEDVIKFTRKIPINEITKSLINQLVRSGTSVGANYCEADAAGSKNDFRHKISICKKQARETKHWLRMIVVINPELKDEARTLWKEYTEQNLTFNAIVPQSNKK